jgi:hypothetical protein
MKKLIDRLAWFASLACMAVIGLINPEFVKRQLDEYRAEDEDE